MKIKKTSKQTPEGAPQGGPSAAGGLERMVWEHLAPRLLHRMEVASIQLLLEAGEPLSLRQLAEATKNTKDHAQHRCKKMQTAGVLEVVRALDREDDEGEEPLSSLSPQSRRRRYQRASATIPRGRKTMPRRRRRDRLANKQTHALNHPLRLRILEMRKRLRGRPLSLETLTTALTQAPEYSHVRLAEVKYHRDRLLDADLLPLSS